ncbi:MAG: hypothetical protein SVZ03_00480 [Spirochaetota bacterium]|nr:hypothetical protein [Spirochaetota bacterium]
MIKRQNNSKVKFIEFTPYDKPEYENRIMNYIIARGENLKRQIKILRIKSEPQKDFLFLKNRLYTIKESYKSITIQKLNTIIKGLTSKYGNSNVQKDNKMAIYSFSNNKTKVIVYSYLKTNKCDIYFYDCKLFHILFSEI